MAALLENKVQNAKLVLLGDVGTGKSSIVLRFVKGQFVEFQESTIGAAFFAQALSVNDETLKFEIWDTAGQERYHSLAPMYYRGAAAAIIVYDIANPATFTRAKKWVQELQSQCNPNTVMALAGNKADLIEARKVTAEEAQAYAQENGLLFMETSAKTATNVNDLFHEIAKRLLQVQAQQQQNTNGVTLMDRADNLSKELQHKKNQIWTTRHDVEEKGRSYFLPARGLASWSFSLLLLEVNYYFMVADYFSKRQLQEKVLWVSLLQLLLLLRAVVPCCWFFL